MRICMLGVGSRGDVQPLVVIGTELMRRGHSVVMIAPDHLAAWVAKSGLEVVATESGMSHVESAACARALARGRRSAAIAKIAAARRFESPSIVRACTRAALPADLLVSSTFTLHQGQCLHDATGAPHVAVTASPIHPTTDFAAFGAPAPHLGLAPVNLLSFRIFQDVCWSIDRPNVDELCDAFGLPRYRRRPRVESVSAICCFSEALVPKPREWKRHEVVGWPRVSADLRARFGEAMPPADLPDWLAEGSRPVCVGFGSTPIADPKALMKTVRRVGRDLGLRLVFVSSQGEFGRTGPRDESTFVSGPVDFDYLFPQCRAVVHHGGSGTTGDVLRAGIPSVIASQYSDQPHWGWFVERAGVGTTFPFSRMTHGSLSEALDRALGPEVVCRARELGERVRAEDACARAADIIEAAGNQQSIKRRRFASRPRG